MDTIFARATAAGRAGVMVMRVSGPQALDILDAAAGPRPAARTMVLRSIGLGADVIDRGLVVWFPSGSSFTGEAVVEFHLHGSVAVERAMECMLLAWPGVRRAEAGEFTRRALLSGAMDLSQVEGLSDLLVAETEAQRRQALSLAAGGLSEMAASWRAALQDIKALVASQIDFADEAVPEDVSAPVGARLGDLIGALEDALAGVGAAERVRDGFTVAILGPPNVGKSTLLNRLAGRDVALVSDQPGTTRDALEVALELDGLAVTFVDTAGLREASDPVEAMGIERARARAAAADLRVFLTVDGRVPEGADVEPGDIVLRGKADLTADGVGVSGLTGAGVDALLDTLGDMFRQRVAGAGPANRQRHREALRMAVEILRTAEGRLVHNGWEDVVADDLERVNACLAALTGSVGVEDVLDTVFSTFCIGK